ncbi:disulfide bond formation protein B [Yunchengibacter salinarum]|uniref:disulfide bond formation protein B n=1 Tax=Yunchengibacter salinarum TaxID=3133399 RepID=UPI0035B60210
MVHALIRSALIRQPVALLGAAALALLMAAWGFEAMGYAPCKLCFWQRYPYMAVVVVALLALLQGGNRNRMALFLMAGLFALDAGIAAYHGGVERGFWKGPDTCTGAPDLTGDLDAALNALQNAAVIRCDAINTSLLGLSMANWNMIAALILTALTVLAARLQTAR